MGMSEKNQAHTTDFSGNIIIRKPFWAYLFGLTIFLIFFAFSLQYKSPAYLSDEIGYLSKAAAIAGYVTDMANQWHAGYSLILAPLFLIFSDPFTIWRGVLFLNAVMCGLSFIVLYYVLINIFPQKNDAQILGAMTICAFYPAFITMSGYAFASSAFSFFFMLVLWTLPKCWGERNLSWCFLNAILVGYLFWIHPTAYGVIAAYIILSLLYRQNWGSFILKLVTICSMVFLYRFLFHPWLNSVMTLGVIGAVEYLPVREVIFRFLDVTYITILIFYIFGQYVYFTVATLGMFNSFLIDFFHNAKNNYQHIVSNKDKFFIPGFIILSFLFIIVIGAMVLITYAPSRYNALFAWLLHGRYPEHIFLPLLGILLLSDSNKFKFFSPIVVLLSGYLYWAPFLKIVPYFNPVNLMAYWPAVLFNENFYAATLVSTLVVLSACYMKKRFMYVVLIALYVVCILHQRNAHLDGIENHSRPSTFVSYIRETFPRGSVVAFDLNSRSLDRMNRYQLYSFFLYDYNYRTMTYEEWSATNDGVFLTFSPYGHSDESFVIASHPLGLYMIVKKHSSFDLFRYRPQNSWLREAEFAKSFCDNISRISINFAGFPTAVNFGNYGNDSNFILSGFSVPESGFRWTDGSKAVLQFWIYNMPDNLTATARFDLFPLLGGGILSAQRVEVFVNESKVADWKLTEPTVKEIALPKFLLRNQQFEMTFLLPNAVSPKDLGINNDTRKLAVAFRAIHFDRDGVIQNKE